MIFFSVIYLLSIAVGAENICYCSPISSCMKDFCLLFINYILYIRLVPIKAIFAQRRIMDKGNLQKRIRDRFTRSLILYLKLLGVDFGISNQKPSLVINCAFSSIWVLKAKAIPAASSIWDYLLPQHLCPSAKSIWDPYVQSPFPLQEANFRDPIRF